MTPDEIYLARDGERTGPHRMDEVRALVARGAYTAADLAWYPGAAGWAALRTVPGFIPAAVPPPVPVTHGPGARPWQAEEAAPRYAGFWIRVAALVIDALVMYIPLRILELVLLRPETGDPALDLGRSLGASAISLVAWWAYESTLHSSEWQATVGKLAVGIRVTDRAGARLSFAHATGRHLAEWLSGLTLGFGYIMAGITERKESLHDKIAETYVVYR